MDKIPVGQKARHSVQLTADHVKLKVFTARENEETVLEGEIWCYTFQPEMRYAG